MTKQLSMLAVLSSALLATSEVNSFSEVFSEATTSGNIKYYYIQTDKDKSYTSQPDTSAKANSIGGQIHFDTARLQGISAGITFMTTNPFLLNDDPTKVDTSIIGKDNGARGGDATKGFSVLGEAHIDYVYGDLMLSYGRKVVKSPLMDAKEVRMLPSSFNGFYSSYTINKTHRVGFDYITEFKQRTSSEFINVVQHALGADTQAVTGSDGGYMLMANYNYKTKKTAINAYDCYAQDFINSIYVDGSYNTQLGGKPLTLALQYINQKSIGKADTNLAQATSVTAGKTISVNAFALKAQTKIKSASFTFAYSKVLKSDAKHDSLVLAWDGTPLFTNMITSNDLFQSIYGNALKADSVYIGGSQGMKIAYKQNLKPLGLEHYSASFAFLNTSNSRFAKDQRDYNVVLGYKPTKHFSLAFKGIWVQDNTSADKAGNISQLKLLSQYRVIANYKF